MVCKIKVKIKMLKQEESTWFSDLLDNPGKL